VSEPDELPRDWWTVADVAQYLEINASTVRTYVSQYRRGADFRHPKFQAHNRAFLGSLIMGPTLTARREGSPTSIAAMILRLAR
jgi:hypothetical protein